MILENGIKTCIISYKKQIASPGLMQDTGSLGLVHWDDPEGWYGEGGGRGGFRMGNTCTLLIVSFVVQKLLILIRSHLFIFAFISNTLGGGS